MRWFKFFLGLFVVSIIATGATYFWKTQYPAERVAIAVADEPNAAPASPSSGEVAADSAEVSSSEPGSASDPQKKRTINIGGGGEEELRSSQTQDLANTLSIVSSVVSLVGTLVSLVVALGFRRSSPTA